MRNTLRKLLEAQCKEYAKVEQCLNGRYVTFTVYDKRSKHSHETFEDLLARAYWVLFCPELDITKHFEEFRNHVLSEAYRLLQREYGQNVRVHAYDQVRSGVDGGLRGLLNTLLRLAVAESSRLRSRTLVEDYWTTTDPGQLVRDSADYVAQYSQLIPHELREKGAGFLRSRFKEILIEHPSSINKLKKEIRR